MARNAKSDRRPPPRSHAHAPAGSKSCVCNRLTEAPHPKPRHHRRRAPGQGHWRPLCLTTRGGHHRRGLVALGIGGAHEAPAALDPRQASRIAAAKRPTCGAGCAWYTRKHGTRYSQAMGTETCREFARNGANVALLDLDGKRVETAAEALAQAFGREMIKAGKGLSSTFPRWPRAPPRPSRARTRLPRWA